MARFDLFAIPAYFVTMGAEYAYFRHRSISEEPGTTPVGGTQPGVTQPGLTRPGIPLGYERRDTITSLSMGTLSLAVPLVAPKLLAPITPGKGRFGRHLVAGAAVAGVVTTIADVVARRAERQTPDDTPGDPRRRRARLARRLTRVTGPAAIGAGTLAATTAWGHATRSSEMWRRRILPDLGTGVVGWAVALVGWDLLYYLNHRLWHSTRFMWANHVMHHSSQRYNLSTALRQATTDPLLFPVPYSTLSLLGVRPDMVLSSRAINLIYQYWIHTEAIRTLGPVEAIANTPSHHRVHHGVNPRYIDRNHGGILIIWDRMFGTFTKEDEPVVYGLTKNIDSFNLFTVNFHEYRDILSDVARSETWRDRLSFAFRGPGWAYDRHRRESAASEAVSSAPVTMEPATS